MLLEGNGCVLCCSVRVSSALCNSLAAQTAEQQASGAHLPPATTRNHLPRAVSSCLQLSRICRQAATISLYLTRSMGKKHLPGNTANSARSFNSLHKWQAETARAPFKEGLLKKTHTKPTKPAGFLSECQLYQWLCNVSLPPDPVHDLHRR